MSVRAAKDYSYKMFMEGGGWLLLVQHQLVMNFVVGVPHKLKQ